jgi:hypothetical protein
VDVGNNTSCSISGIETEQAYYFAATAYNEIGESDFSEEIVYRISSEPDPSVEPDPFTDPPVEPDPSTDPPVEPDPSTDPLDEIIIDNGDESTFFTGTWKISRYSSPYGNDSLFSRDNGSRYGFEAALSGSYVVSLCWNKHRRSCSRVPVEIYDGNTRIAIVEVNQQRDGGQWNELGEYSFNGTARVAVVSKGGCITGVDAVEFASNDAPAPSIYQITASAGSGGSISPAGEVTVSLGSSATYIIQPNSGYHITDVKVDDNSVGAVTSYTFQNVSADHTITASFDTDATPPSSGKSRGWRRWWWWR